MLTVSELAGASLISKPIRVEFITSLVSSAAKTTYTFTSVSLGTPAEDRRIVVTAYASDETSNRFLSSATIAGSAATISVQTRNGDSGSSYTTAIFEIIDTVNATGDIELTYSTDMNQCGIGVWALYGTKDTAADTSFDNSETINVEAYTALIREYDGGCVIAVTGASDSSNPAAPHFQWTDTLNGNHVDMIKTYDQKPEGSHFDSGAYRLSSSFRNNIKVASEDSVGTVFDSDKRSMCVASWKPAGYPNNSSSS